MKKIVICILVLCVILSISGCNSIEEILSPSAPETAIFNIAGYGLQLTADTDFRESTGGNYDMQITNDDCYISIMAFSYIDLPQDVSPADVYDMQNQDLFSRRENTVIIEALQTKSDSGRTILRTLYSAEKSGSKNYYGSYLIDFPTEKTFAWILVSAVPSYYQSHSTYLHGIVTSLTKLS